MIEVKPFKLDMIKQNESFYCLQKISNVSEIDIFHNTPSGAVEYPKINAFSMPNGKIIIAWTNSINMFQFYNLIASSNGVTEIIPMNSIEKVFDIYDKPTNSNYGVFSFASSNVILEPNIDWRCDNGKYGPGAFPPNYRIVFEPNNIVLFEPVISVVGVGHLVYIEYTTASHLADQHLNNAEKPVIGRSFWECLKLIREWSIVNEEPFNNNEAIAVKANEFIKNLNFSSEELSIIDKQSEMQIFKYILGDNNARQRPDHLLEIDDEIKRIMFNRLSSGTLSAIEYLNPGMWNLEELIEIEKQDIQERREIFSLSSNGLDTPDNFRNLKNRLFDNRELILSKIENGEF